MSMELMVKAMKTKVGNPLRKLVLIKLADNASDNGECWPSYQHIADQCEISRRSVISHIKDLEKTGLLKKIERKGGEKGNHSNLYVLDFSGSETPAPPSESPALGGESPALPPSESPAPRTSHSFEPVKEPTPPNPQGGSADAPEPAPAQKPRKAIPFEQIKNLFNEILPELPTVILINKSREANIRARWNEHEAHRSLEFWEDLFTEIRKSDFLMGRTLSDRPFMLTFDWLLKPSNFVKVVEGNYHG